MRKKIGILLIVGSLGALCAGLAACSDGNKVDEYFKDGYVITVTYDASGGEIAGGTNVTLMDMFNPDQWPADESGNVHIKLKEPTATNRPKPGADNITVTHGDDTLIGWYKTRNVVTVDGKAVDADGNELVEQNGKYYKTGEGSNLVETTPAYTYSDPWNFATDRIDFNKNDEKYDLTLYAAWTEKFTFQYFYKELNEDGTDKDMEWTEYGSATKFDYSPNTEQKLYVPRWSQDTGKMVYRNSGFNFPSLSNMTFDSAYYVDEDTEGLVKIEDSFIHQGYVDMNTAKAYAPDQKICVKFKKGNYYRISTAKQFADISDANGHYTVTTDELDFKYSIADNVVTKGEGGVAWPRALMSSDFTGSIEGENGEVTFKNIYAQYANTSARYGGLFGTIKNGAALKNITFENAIVDIALATYSQTGSFGALAGEIESNAVIENVSISGHLRLGQIKMKSANVNLVADGKTEGITENIALTIYGEKDGSVFAFYVNPDTATVNEDGSVTLELISEYLADSVRQRDKQYYLIDKTDNGGEE